MMKVTKGNESIRVETGGAVFEWDMNRGAQLVRCDVKSPQKEHAVLQPGQVAPNLTLDLGDRRISLSEIKPEISFEREDDQAVVFTARGALADLFHVEQRFEVFREGVLFCELGLFLNEGKSVAVRNAEMRFDLAVGNARSLRQNYVSLDPYLKQDVTCVHVLCTPKISLPREQKIDEPQLLPAYGFDLGWEESRYYSNKVEFVIEDSTSFGNGMLGPTRTMAGERGGSWELVWKVAENSADRVSAPFHYRNKWGIFCCRARTESGAGADAAVRNNILGSRFCHVMYPYVRGGQDWPWCSVPIKQVWYQDAQIAKENPAPKRITEAVRAGADVAIIHQFWMRNGGSNGESAADYKVHDPKWFKAFVGKAHRKGMRVAVYMRGIEHYSLYMDFFEKYLIRDRDGLYIDWATPFGIGFAKASVKHCSIYNWFMFTRALRQRVGEQGFLIGHSAMQLCASYAAFDSTLTGEFSVLHSGLLAEPEISASYTGMGCVGVHLMAGNAPDRVLFSSQKAAAYSAAFGYGNHPFMEPGKDYMECSAYIRPLWRLLEALGSSPVRVFNPAVGTMPVARSGNSAIHPLVYQAADGRALVLATNLSEQPLDRASVEVDFAALGLPASTTLTPIKAKGTHTPAVSGATLAFENMGAYQFGGAIAAPA